MYKITLYDQNCSPIHDGTTFWFVEDLTEFEKKWVPLQAKIDIGAVERYYKSKFGETIMDYHSTDAGLNIVQSVECEILQEKVFEYVDKEVKLTNAYGWSSKILFDRLKVVLRVQRCNDKYYLVGQYFCHGCRRVESNINRWYDTEVKYSQMNFYGNPVAKYSKRGIDWEDQGKSDAYKDFYTNDKDFYKHEKVETFVWLPIKEVSEQYKIRKVNTSDLSLLLMDIVGEAG